MCSVCSKSPKESMRKIETRESRTVRRIEEAECWLPVLPLFFEFEVKYSGYASCVGCHLYGEVVYRVDVSLAVRGMPAASPNLENQSRSCLFFLLLLMVLFVVLLNVVNYHVTAKQTGTVGTDFLSSLQSRFSFLG